MFIHLPLIYFAPPPRLLIDFKNSKWLTYFCILLCICYCFSHLIGASYYVFVIVFHLIMYLLFLHLIMYLLLFFSPDLHLIMYLLLFFSLHCLCSSTSHLFISHLHLVYWSTLKIANDLPIFASYYVFVIVFLTWLAYVRSHDYLSYINSLVFLFIFCFSLTKGQCSKR